MKLVWEKWMKMPSALQRQSVQRLGLGVLMLILFAIIRAVAGSFQQALPGLILAGFFLASGGALLYKGISGKYICIAGIVKQVEVSGFRRKPKAIFLDVESRILQLPAPPKTPSIAVGDKFTVFLSPDTPIYEQDGTYRAFTCLALVNER